MHIKLIAALAAAIALAGCAAKKPAEPEFVELQTEDTATTCTPSAVDLGSATPATITMTNDGWCGVSTTEKDGQPFVLGLVKARPAHGRVYIRPVNKQTRVEYTPNPGYVGSDAFTVALRPRTPDAADNTLRVDVNVTPGEQQPVAAAPAPTPKPATPARTATRRHTTRH